MTITAPNYGDLADPAWAQEITAAVNALNDYATLLASLNGTWSTYVPVLTNFNVGAGSTIGWYLQAGKTVDFYVRATLGSGFSVGTSPTCTLPVAMASLYNDESALPFGGEARDSGVTGRQCQIAYSSSTVVTVNFWNATPAPTAITSVAPFTWGSGDRLALWGRYQSA